MSSSKGSELWNEGLKLVSFCPICETRYNPMEAKMLGQDGETHLLHVQCRKCQNSILALVLVNQIGASSVGLLTDLTFEDVLRFRTSTAISIDDVIDIHGYLETAQWDELLGGMYRQKLQTVLRKRANKAKKNQAAG